MLFRVVEHHAHVERVVDDVGQSVHLGRRYQRAVEALWYQFGVVFESKVLLEPKQWHNETYTLSSALFAFLGDEFFLDQVVGLLSIEDRQRGLGGFI